MDLEARTVTRQGRSVPLSPTGWRLLEALLRRAPQVVSRQKLLRDVWGEDAPDSDSLKVHLFHLRRAVDAAFTPKLLHTVAGHGVALRREED